MGGRQGLVQAGRAAGFALAHARLHVRLGSDSRGSALPAPLPPNAAARVRAPGQPPAPCPRVPVSHVPLPLSWSTSHFNVRDRAFLQTRSCLPGLVLPGHGHCAGKRQPGSAQQSALHRSGVCRPLLAVCHTRVMLGAGSAGPGMMGWWGSSAVPRLGQLRACCSALPQSSACKGTIPISSPA